MKYLKEHPRISITTIILFFICALLAPVYFTKVSSPYYSEIILSNILFIVCAIVLFFTTDKKSENKIFIWLIFSFLVLYDLFFIFYITRTGQWSYEALNVTAAFLAFIILLSLDTETLFKKYYIAEILIITILVSVIISIAVYHLGYTSVSFLNGNVTFTPHDPNYYETRFSWFFFHKSQYCFFLLLSISLFVRYKDVFKNKILFCLSLAVLLYGIYISHTYTALFASLFIFGGAAADYLLPRLSKIRKQYFLFLTPPACIALYFLYRMSEERNIWNLGGRLNIWKESINQILQYNEGIGDLFGGLAFPVPGLTFEVYNCHNYFLNIMYRFSLPAGLFFALIFLTIIVFSLKNHFSFFTIGIWTALLISLGMDYALLTTDLPITLLMLYCLFFSRRRAAQH